MRPEDPGTLRQIVLKLEILESKVTLLPQRLNAQRMRLVSVYCKKELVSEQGLDVVATTANVQLNWAVTVFNAFFG